MEHGERFNAAYGYGLSANIEGDFAGAAETVWDTVVVAHEIGHNFGSPHTHGYCNVGGNAKPVDLCSAGEDACSGRASVGLPGVGSLTGGTAGAGKGTIMSYCHLRSGGLSNIAMTFGAGHQYGVAADRVPQTMFAEVQSSVQNYPGCLDPADFLLTITKNGAGRGHCNQQSCGH